MSAVPSSLREGATSHEEINPRLGLKWRLLPGQTLRLAGQAWRKPAGVSTLAPIDTVGIPLDDRVMQPGGRFERARLQHDIELGRATFLQWFADSKHVKNLDDPGNQIANAIDRGTMRAKFVELLDEEPFDQFAEWAESLTAIADAIATARDSIGFWIDAEGREEKGYAKDGALDACQELVDLWSNAPIDVSQLVEWEPADEDDEQ